MATKITRLTILGLLALNLPLLSAQTLFDENFQSATYRADMPVPAGAGVLTQGEWGKPVRQARPAVVIAENGNQIIELKAQSSFPRGARAIAFLGEAGKEAAPTDKALDISLRFKISAPLTRMYIQVIGTDGRGKAIIRMDEGEDRLYASFSGKYRALGSTIEPGKWYSLQVQLPEQPQTNKQYRVTLFDGESGAEIASLSGRLARSVETGGENYQNIDIQHNTPDQSLYIDDLTVKTVQ